MRNQLRFEQETFRVDLIDQHPLHVHIHAGEDVHELRLEGKLSPGKGRVRLGDRYVPYFVTRTPTAVWVTLDGHTRRFERSRERAQAEEGHGGFTAPMPGKVIAVEVEEGETVEQGRTLVIMEAMKMEHRIEAPSPGRVSALHCREGEVVAQGTILIELSPE